MTSTRKQPIRFITKNLRGNNLSQVKIGKYNYS